MYLLHAFPLYGPMNGTFFVDTKEWPHKCNETGGWGDFFASDKVIVHPYMHRSIHPSIHGPIHLPIWAAGGLLCD
jgi:hypothetical protein